MNTTISAQKAAVDQVRALVVEDNVVMNKEATELDNFSQEF